MAKRRKPYSEIREKNAKWRKANVERIRHYSYKARYGITLEEVEIMTVEQGGLVSCLPEGSASSR